MALPRVLKNFNLFVDGRGYAGRVTEIELPKLTVKVDDFRAGGMDLPAAIDMGMEKLECSFSLAEYDENVLKLFGLANGNAVQVTARGAIQADSLDAVPVAINLRGAIKGLEQGTWKAGEKPILKCSMALRYYRETVGGDDLIEIDVENMVRKIGGVDQLAGIRAAIGA